MTEQQTNSLKALAMLIDAACDEEGHPLPQGLPEKIAFRLTKSAPVLLNLMAEMARGRVT